MYLSKAIPSSEKEGNAAVDLLRHYFAVGVIFIHMVSQARYSASTNFELAEFNDLIDGAVYGFFAISGVFFRPPLSFYTFFVRQFFRLMVPFLVFSLIYAVALWFLGKATLVAGLTATLTLHGAGMQLYFLPFLFFLTALFGTLTSFLQRNFTSLEMCSIFLLLTFLALVFPVSSSTGGDYRQLFMYGAAFVFGMCVGRGSDLYIVYFVAFLSAVAAFFDSRFVDLIFVFFAVFMAVYLGKYFPRRRLWGSGAVYLLHTPVLNFAISDVFYRMGVLGWSNILASVFFTYFFCLISAFLMIRFFPRFRYLILE